MQAAQQKYITIIQAANALGRTYSSARGWLTVNQCLHFEGNQVLVDAAKLKKISPKIQLQPGMKAKDPAVKDLCTWRQLIAALPLVHGNIQDEEQLRRCLKLSPHYFLKTVNKVNYYRMQQFIDPQSWRWPAEDLARLAAASFKPPLNEVQAKVVTLLQTWAGMLKERRTAGLRGAGTLAEAVFQERYTSTLQTISQAPWAAVKGMLPRGFNPKELLP